MATLVYLRDNIDYTFTTVDDARTAANASTQPINLHGDI